ncbi:MAG: acyl-CoA thioesterase [Desulfobacterales bacterium]|jgi:acyl-CoA thioester hydrolase|nr:acyl-CoA thioesterase [Desulfobacterales bacterium]
MNSPIAEDYPVVVDVPVAWGEMDAYGHVNNIVYFRYFETVRMAYFERLDFPDFINRNPLGPILASTSCRFRAPLVFPDHVSVGARVARINEDRFVMFYGVYSHRLQKVAAEGEGVIVCFDYRENRKASLPEALRRKIAHLEGTVGATRLRSDHVDRSRQQT